MTTISGHFTYHETTIMQHREIGNAFKKLFLETQPTRILEIGTSSGGLTLLLQDLLDELNLQNTEILTYDINPDHSTYWLRERINNGANINFQIKNIFNQAYDALINENEPREFIQKMGVTIVLCDGGSKINEFNILSKYLKVGDIIMAHDYSSTTEYFEKNIKNKIWNWMEIKDSDIAAACDKYNLHSFLQDIFQDVVWVCKIKK